MRLGFMGFLCVRDFTADCGNRSGLVLNMSKKFSFSSVEGGYLARFQGHSIGRDISTPVTLRKSKHVLSKLQIDTIISSVLPPVPQLNGIL